LDALESLKASVVPTPVATPITTPSRAPELAVRDTLEEFAAAYKSRNPENVRKVWPSVQRNYYADWSLVESQEWVLSEPPKITVGITGSDATAVCRVTERVVWGRGKRLTNDIYIYEIKLKQQPQGWKIDSLTRTPSK
jgi:uncharacterized secreted protein with C-terminal beta-propeller domain